MEREVGEVQGQSPGGEEQPKASIAKRVQTRPWPRNPSSMHSSRTYTRTKWLRRVGDASPLGSLENANVEAIMRAVAKEGFPTGEVRVDDVKGCVDVGMVAEEGAAGAAEGTAGGDGGWQSLCDVVVDAGAMVTDEKYDEGVAKDGPEVVTQSEKVGTYDGPMAAELMPYAVRRMIRKLRPVRLHRRRHPQLLKASLMRSMFMSLISYFSAEGRDGSGTPYAVAVVVTMSQEDSSPTSAKATHGRQPPRDNTSHL
ncbi:hypothetical protein Cgig2_006579 [Carnegiea gigantea]|uniref:Uncharacterized protein n=1 Tax=Carnegiea gigantea TaxID=171969 RepID=A0A9Q1KLZ8_9CARY|nr:hypothetical protein Cgig2_006579 [Carnegiea gigantea]